MNRIPTFKSPLGLKDLNRMVWQIVKRHNGYDYVNEFQYSLAEYLDIENLIRVPSARWGLYYTLKHLNIPPGSEVILSAFNYYAVPAAIIKAGMVPVFTDIAGDKLNIDVRRIEDAITGKTKVIIATHLCGFVCDMDGICAIADKKGLIIIEDCVQSLGAEYNEKKAGSIGDAAFFSFGVTKNLTTLGNGMVATNNSTLATAIKTDLAKIKETSFWDLSMQLLRTYNIVLATSVFFSSIYWIIRLLDKLDIDIIDLIFREKESLMREMPATGLLNCIQAETGLNQLGFLNRNTELRIKKGLRIYNLLKKNPKIKIPVLEKNAKNIFTSCPVMIKNRNNVRKYLLKHSIVTSFGFMHNCSNFKLFVKYRKDCVNAEKASREIIYLPFFTSMHNREIVHIINSIGKMVKSE